MVVSRKPDAVVDAMVYPDSDGMPMADNTKQFDLIVLIKENLDLIVDDFVAGDLLWYPVEGQPKIRVAPDVLVAFGRPKGYRGSYKQWEEDGVAPQVVFEVLSPSNSTREMMIKIGFYQRYGVDEFYVIDPDGPGYGFARRGDDGLQPIDTLDGWESPLLGMRFAWDAEAEDNRFYAPDGSQFLSLREVTVHAAAAEAGRAAAEAGRAAAEAKAAALATKLRELGMDPDAL